MERQAEASQVAAGGIALYGGSFNPIHNGHLIVARDVAERIGVSRVVLIPSASPPHKQGRTDLAPAHHRLEMVKLAIEGEPLFTASEIEIQRSGPSYTIHTVESYRASLPPETPLYWIVGGDSLPELGTWFRARDLVDLCTIVTAVRPGYEQADLSPLQPTLRPDQVRRLQENVLPTSRIDIAARTIRARVREGRSIRYLVPEAVRTYIEINQLYR